MDTLRQFDGQNPFGLGLTAALYPRSGYIHQNFDAVFEVGCPSKKSGYL
jgi:hypothetical protein